MPEAQHGDIEGMQGRLEEGADINWRSPRYGTTALMAAAEFVKKDAVAFLLERGADVNLKDKVGRTALHFACKRSPDPPEPGRVEIIKLLLEHGADRHARTDRGQTPLDYAKESGVVAIIDALQ